MKKNLIRNIFVLLLAPAVLLSFTTKPDRANFSGDWKLNKDKSDLGQFGDYATTTIKAIQTNDSISIARTAPSFQGGENTSNETLTFDGKESNTKLFGESTKKSTLKWADDGQTFTLTYQLMLDFNGQQTEINGTETWSLSDGGKTLTVDSKSSSSFGDLTTKAIYQK